MLLLPTTLWIDVSWSNPRYPRYYALSNLDTAYPCSHYGKPLSGAIWNTAVNCGPPIQLVSPSHWELLQRAFVSRIEGMHGLSYWDQLCKLKLFSLERRRERYQIIYTWRIIEGQVPNLDCTPIRVTCSDRRGRSCIPPHIPSSAPERTKSIRFASLSHKGPRLFNSLPADIRNLTGCTLATFKGALDKHLVSIPDEPLIPSMTQYRRCETNSIVEWELSPLVKQHRRKTGTTLPLLERKDSQALTAF